MTDPRPLHRIFGMSWKDFFHGTTVVVELEMDLSLKQQFLDVVIIHKGPEPIPWPLPDGFEDLGPHNLLTFKSYQEALDAWALLELIGHYVNYRKQSSPSMSDLLPESEYRLYAVCVRYPHNLAQQFPLTELRPGVYELRVLTAAIRIIVASQLRKEEQNAMLHLLTKRKELVSYGKAHYRIHSSVMSTVLLELFKMYEEDPDVADDLKEFARKALDEFLNSLPPDERLKGLPAKERVKGLSPEERMEGLSVEDVLRSLPAEDVEAFARKLKPNGSPPKS
jgi:hypothetical protein